ncbi:hypothetical protein SCP_0101310 [Sparassis crispa]|uniref:Uncharacterized protein n=1 Tax=Sparassis crispa TaxID=139825 RepID=A0A401G512_9APHY|nr:hypothetical protein SCP_0101310 [Sparassis crispa]GBE77258.1 hypothetical protein SCP_0101310 [Sparassis crispa]
MRSFFSVIILAVLVLLSSPTTASPAPSGVARRSAPSAVPRHQARSPQPSGAARRSIPEQESLVNHLCPSSMTACPISSSSSLASIPTSLAEWLEDGFECVDFSADLVSCGGCSSLDTK